MKVVLAYSGGLDTSVILAWLIEEKGAEVVTYTADVGQGEEVEEARLKALDTGAVAAVVEDLRSEFVRDAVFPALRASAVYEWYYLLGTSLARPIITRGMMKTVKAVGADAIAHGATGKGNDQVRFELSAFALDPDIKVIAPWREWKLRGRADLVAYAEEKGIKIPTTPEKPYSTDANLLHISYEGGVLEDPWVRPPEGMFKLTVDPESAPDEPEVVTVTFEGGNPVAINGEALDPVAHSGNRQQAGRSTRGGPGRHRREPVRRDEEPRGVRDSGRNPAPSCPPGSRVDHPRPRSRPPPRRADPSVCRDGLQRLLVLPRATGAAGLHGRGAEAGQR